MKKTSLFKVLTLISILFLFLGLAACKNGGDSSLSGGNLPPLKTPENVYLSFNQTAEGKTEFIVTWDKVKNAYEYRVKLNGKTLSTIKTECDVTQYVTVGKITVIEVWATGVKGEYSSSPKVTLTCTPKKVSKGLLYTEIDGGYEIFWSDDCDGDELILPDTYLGKPITKTRDCTYNKHKSFKAVRMPMDLQYIGNYSFCSFVMLEKLVIPPKVKTIGECAFLCCERLTSVDLANVEVMGVGCFNGCDLREVFVPKTVRKLDGTAGNKNLTSIVLEDGMNIEEYGEGVFSSTAITSIPEGLPVITEYMFGDCYALTDAYIPDTVKRIEAKAFSSCNNLKSIHIPASVEHLSGGMYSNIPDNVEIYFAEGSPFEAKNGYVISKDGKQLIHYSKGNTAESFTLPSTVEVIGEYAFAGVKNLKQIYLPEGLKVIGDYAFLSSGLTSIDLPDSVVQIGTQAFSRVKGITTITIPKGVTSLPDMVFVATYLKHIDIPDNVTSIGDDAFVGSSYLESVVLHKYITYFSPNRRPFANGLTPLKILPNIFFRGTEAELNELFEKGFIYKEAFIDHGRQMPIYFYSEEEPPKIIGGMQYDNNYWHYDENGMPVIWEIEK